MGHDRSLLRRLRDAVRLLGPPGATGRASAQVPRPPSTVPAEDGPRHGEPACVAIVATAIARPLVDHGPPPCGAWPGEIVEAVLPDDDGQPPAALTAVVIGRLRDDLAVLASTGRSGRQRLELPPGDVVGSSPAALRLDRVLRVDPTAVRRTGAVLAPHELDLVVTAWRGW